MTGTYLSVALCCLLICSSKALPPFLADTGVPEVSSVYKPTNGKVVFCRTSI